MGGYNPPMPSPTLIRFLRDVLGCGCPDEVLQSIAVERGRRVPGLDAEMARLDAGGRLLVYLVEVSSTEAVDALVATALESGLADRDGHGFNRFRLVLATASPATIKPAARAAFDDCARPDDRVHLHVIAVEELPPFG